MDKQEQYSKRNYILIHGFKEAKNESTDDRVLKTFTQELNEDILLVDLDRTHRIEKKRYLDSKPRPVIVNLQGTIFVKNYLKVKKKLKGKNISITEILTGY